MAHDLTAFARGLSWSGPILDCCQAWLGACHDLLEQRFRAYCERSPKLAWLLSAYRGLPEPVRKKLLLSPRLSHQLLAADAGRTPAFAAMAPDVVGVLARSSAGPADASLAGMLAAFGRDDGEVRGIPLDFDSTTSLFYEAPDVAELHPVPPDRAVQARQCLETALGALEQGNPTALEYVCLLTRRLVVREKEGPAGCYGSFTFPDWVGLILLTNVWAEGAHTAHLVDALVHESTHSALILYETTQGPLLADRSWSDRLRSPWTGNALDRYTYIHACFVWFGLTQLWRSWPAGAGGVSAAWVQRLYQRASRGFLARPVQALLSQPRSPLIPPVVQEALCVLEQDALDACAHPLCLDEP